MSFLDSMRKTNLQLVVFQEFNKFPGAVYHLIMLPVVIIGEIKARRFRMIQHKKFKANKITLFSRRCSTLIFFCLISLIIMTWNRSVFAQGDCGDCPHPLVGLAEMKITGDLEAVRDIINGYMDYQFTGRLPERTAGWDNLLRRDDGILPLDLAARINALDTFRLKNPCAKLILTYQKVGAAKKYRIESTAEIKIGNGQVVVEHESDTGIEKLAVPRIGTIHIKHELIALKNGQIYDTGREIIDWVTPPPPPSDKYRATQGTIMPGYFDTPDLHCKEISLSHGDVGITIRKKETPSSCSIKVDHQSKYPPFFEIKVKEIKNLFAEKMPDNVKIAFKAEKGEIMNGEEIDGWRIFSTKGGEIGTPIMYKPPKCNESDTDFLKIAGVCDFHDGPISIGKERFKKKILNPYCHDVTAKITITKTNTRDFNETKGQPGSYHSIEQSNYKENFKCEIFLTCEKEPRIDYKADRKSFKIKIQRYYYLVKSARIQSASYEGQYSGHGKNSDAVGLRHSWNNNRSTSGLDFKLKSRASDPSIEITFDPSTGLITRVHLPTYYLTGTINEKYNVSGVKRESRKEWRYDYKLVPYNRNETKTSDLEFYSTHPSFDEPESCWKATGNMNTKFLRGQCSQIRNHKYLTEEETYKWEVTIRKNE